jgi:hypothetical protein
VTAALAWANNGSTSNPLVARIALRRAFWKNFGTDIDAAWRTWPEQEFHDTLSLLNAEAKVANSKSGSGSPERAKATQAAFDAMPRITREEQQRQIAEAAAAAE